MRSARNVATTMFGGVPIAVTSPPSRLANDSGMSSCEGGRRAFLASRSEIGSISASAPMLFMNADSSIVMPQFATSWRESVPRARASRRRNSSTTPDPCSAWLITSTEATVITAGWPKPSNACSAGTMPVYTHAISATPATMS